MALARPTILQIVPRLDTGGAELTTLEIVSALAKAGARALVASEGGRMAGEVMRLGGELIEFPAATKNPARLLANAYLLTQLMKKSGVDLIHARSRAPAWSAFIAARRTGTPFVTTYHGAYGESGRLKRLYNGVMARADLVIANSEFTGRLVRERYGTPTERLRVIHRGVDLERFEMSELEGQGQERIKAMRETLGAKPGQRIILNAARLAGWKGQRVLIEAAHRLKDGACAGDCLFVLAGDAQGRDGYREDLNARIAAAGLGGHAVLPGHLSDMPAAYALAHVAVVASTEPEAFGRTATEAQAMGCPVIATSIGAPPETVLAPPLVAESARTGWLVPPGSAEALAEAIAAALALDPMQRATMRASARRNVEARFSLARMQEATLCVYDELLRTRLAADFRGQLSQRTMAP